VLFCCVFRLQLRGGPQKFTTIPSKQEKQNCLSSIDTYTNGGWVRVANLICTHNSTRLCRPKCITGYLDEPRFCFDSPCHRLTSHDECTDSPQPIDDSTRVYELCCFLAMRW
jgi:hypothetical protein